MTLNPFETVSRGRARAEELMRDRCVVERETGQRVFNEDTGQYEHEWVPVYEGKCRVQVAKWKPTEETPGGAVTYHIDEANVQLPIDATIYKRGDRVRVTYASMDPALLAKPMIVKSANEKTHDIMRKLGVAEVSV